MFGKSDQSALFPPAAKRIFVWHQGALGDVLLAGAALQAVAEQYPGSSLTLVGTAERLHLLTDTLPAAAVWSGHRARWLGLFQDEGDIDRELTDALSHFDLALIVTPLKRPVFLNRLKLAGIPRVIWLPSFPTEARVPVRELHAGKLAAAGLKSPLTPWRLRLSEAEHREARQWLQEQAPPDLLRVVLAPGSGHPRKNWPLEHYAELARGLEELYGAHIWWVLGPAESGWQEKISARRILRDLSLRQLAARLAEFELYVGNDSGVTHLAAALGRPAVAAIFGPSDPVIWAPQGERTVVITPAEPCAPCTQGREIACARPVCLTSLTPEQVLARISRLLTGIGC